MLIRRCGPRVAAMVLLLAAACLCPQLRAQESLSPSPLAPAAEAPKDPAVARGLALLGFGAAHYYTGEKGKAVVLTALPIVTFTVGLVATGSATNCHSSESGEYVCPSQALPAEFLLAVSGYAVSWIYGVLDAGPSARRVTARNGGALQVGVMPRSSVPGFASEQWLIGVRIPAR